MLELDGFIIVIMLQQALLAVSLYVPLMGGQLSLASPAFYAIGGYLAALLSAYLVSLPGFADQELYPWYLVLIEMSLAGFLSFILAYGLGRPLLRLRGIYLALATLSLVEIVRVLSLNLSFTGGAIGIFSIPQVFDEQNSYLYLFGPLLFLTLGLVWRLEKSQFGQALRSIREDEYASAAMGIDPASLKNRAFAIGAAIAGVTGAASAHLLNTWNARQGTFDLSVNLLAYVMIGGPWSVWGGALGGSMLSALPELLRPLADYRLVVNGALIVLACLYLPRGLLRDRHLKAPKRSTQAKRPLRRSSSIENSHAPLLTVAGLSVHFGGLKAVQDVSFEVKRGEIFGLIGPNGAGKTTVFNVLTGFVQSSAGSIQLHGQEISRESVHHRAQRGILRTFQNLRLFKQQTALENVLAAKHRFADAAQSTHAIEDALYWLAFVGLESKADERASQLNYGDQRRLELARALMAQPELLLLDEPVAGMNLSEKSEMQKLILRMRDELGLTIMLIEHHVPLVLGLCDRIAVLNFGQMIAVGHGAEIQQNPEVRRAYLGVEGE